MKTKDSEINGQPLNREHFKCIGDRGVTDPYNGYAHSMEWFQNKLYIGTTRAPLCILKRTGRVLPPPHFDFWPIECPYPEDPEIMRAHIASYDFAEKKWELLHRSPLVEKDGKTFAREMLYRGMTVYQGTDDPDPALYVGGLSSWGCQILKTNDGRTFRDPDDVLSATSVRTLCNFRGKVFTSPVGIPGREANESEFVEVVESKNPSSGKWTRASESGFGDKNNRAFFDIAVFNDHLYVTTMNPVGGFQLWKSRAEGNPPYRWQKVITAGAFRGVLNQFGLCLCPFGDALYIGTGIAGGGYDRWNHVGPAAAEVIKVYADDTWDLVVGAARVTPVGLKCPTSGMGPGFDNFMNGYIWRMIVHDGWLYIGSYNWGAFLQFNPHSLERPDEATRREIARFLPTGDIDRYVEEFGGCELWRTRDGHNFYPVQRNGFGSYFNTGIRRFVSSEAGLFVGTVNQFGPRVGVKENGQWRYEENPRGGVEIWHGHVDHAPKRERVAEFVTRDEQDYRAKVWFIRRFDSLVKHIFMELVYANSGFHHVGYWKKGATNAQTACLAMVDHCMAPLGKLKGRWLDLGCGRGGTSEALLKYLSVDQLDILDQDQTLLDFATERNSELKVILGDPTNTTLDSETYEGITIFEALPTIHTRRAVLKEAHRLLRPGGKLVITDIIFNRESVRARNGMFRENHIRNLDHYRKLLSDEGYTIERFETAEKETLEPYNQKIRDQVIKGYREGILTEQKFSFSMGVMANLVLFSKHYLVITATRKPESK